MSRRSALRSTVRALAASAAVGFTKDEFSHRATALVDGQLRNKFRTLLEIKMLTSDPAVRYAEPNYLMQITAIPDDELYVQQWHYPLNSKLRIAIGGES